MEKQTTWIKSKMTTALSEETIGKLTDLVSGLPEETNINNVSKLLVYLIETEPQVNQVNIKETAVYLELENLFTELETKYDGLLTQPPVDIKETEVYQDLQDRFTELETQYKLATETIVNIEETKVYLNLQKRFTDLETKYKSLPKETKVNVKETEVYLTLVNQFTTLETMYNKLLSETTAKKPSTFYWEG
jgi:hypothetical protein